MTVLAGIVAENLLALQAMRFWRLKGSVTAVTTDEPKDM
jgi:hypothetical protein